MECECCSVKNELMKVVERSRKKGREPIKVIMALMATACELVYNNSDSENGEENAKLFMAIAQDIVDRMEWEECN